MDWLLQNWTTVIAAALTVATVITRVTRGRYDYGRGEAGWALDALE